MYLKLLLSDKNNKKDEYRNIKLFKKHASIYARC